MPCATVRLIIINDVRSVVRKDDMSNEKDIQHCSEGVGKERKDECMMPRNK